MEKKDLLALISEGVELHLDGKFEEAENKYVSILEGEPFNPVVHNNLGFLYTQKKMYREAIHEFNKAISLREEYPTAYKNLGITFMMMNSLDEAEDTLLKALSQDENDESIYENLAKLYTLKGKWHKSEIYWKKNYELLQDNDKLIDIAQALIRQSKFSEASILLNEILELNDENPTAYFLLGIINFASDDYGTAIRCFRHALGIEPENPEIRHHMAITMLKLSMITEAKEELQRIILLNPMHTESRNDLAVIELAANQTGYSLQQLNKVLELDPLNAKARYYKAIIYIQQDKKEDAVRLLKDIVESGNIQYEDNATQLLRSLN